MKLLYAAHNSADPGKGAAFADISLLKAVRERGHDVDEMWNVGWPRAICHNNLHLLLEAPTKCMRIVASQCVEHDYDVIMVNQPLGWKAARWVRRHCPETLFIARSHGWEPRVYEETFLFAQNDERGRMRRFASNVLRPLLFRQNRLVAKHADGMVVCSKDDKEWITRTMSVSSDNVLALAPGLPAEFVAYAPVEMTSKRLRQLLYVGQFAAFKAPEIVARVISEVLRTRQDTSATWVCAKADHNNIRRLLNKEIAARVAFLEWMPRSELISVYDQHGIYLFPSYFEGFAQTFLEAMSRGLVVLASRVDGMAQTIRDGENGYLFEKGDVVGMANRVRALVDQASVAVRVAENARKTASNMTWSRSAGEFLAFVDMLVNRAGQQRT